MCKINKKKYLGCSSAFVSYQWSVLSLNPFLSIKGKSVVNYLPYAQCYFSKSQNLWLQESRGEMRVAPLIITPSDPLAKILLSIPVTLCSGWPEGLSPKGKKLPAEDRTMISLNLKLRLQPSHVGLLIHLNQQAKNRVTVLTPVSDPSYWGKKMVYCFPMEVRKNMFGIQEIP